MFGQCDLVLWIEREDVGRHMIVGVCGVGRKLVATAYGVEIGTLIEVEPPKNPVLRQIVAALMASSMPLSSVLFEARSRKFRGHIGLIARKVLVRSLLLL